jgi:hypothetical protein
MNNMMKMEDTFLMVRDSAAGVNDPLNDMSMALGDRILPADYDMMEGSAFRNMPDEAAEFEDVMLRNEIGDHY